MFDHPGATSPTTTQWFSFWICKQQFFDRRYIIRRNYLALGYNCRQWSQDTKSVAESKRRSHWFRDKNNLKATHSSIFSSDHKLFFIQRKSLYPWIESTYRNRKYLIRLQGSYGRTSSSELPLSQRCSTHEFTDFSIPPPTFHFLYWDSATTCTSAIPPTTLTEFELLRPPAIIILPLALFYLSPSVIVSTSSLKDNRFLT